jgi:hypothetical protein
MPRSTKICFDATVVAAVVAAATEADVSSTPKPRPTTAELLSPDISRKIALAKGLDGVASRSQLLSARDSGQISSRRRSSIIAAPRDNNASPSLSALFSDLTDDPEANSSAANTERSARRRSMALDEFKRRSAANIGRAFRVSLKIAFDNYSRVNSASTLDEKGFFHTLLKEFPVGSTLGTEVDIDQLKLIIHAASNRCDSTEGGCTIPAGAHYSHHTVHVAKMILESRDLYLGFDLEQFELMMLANPTVMGTNGSTIQQVLPVGCISCGCCFVPDETVIASYPKCSSGPCEDIRARACASCTSFQSRGTWADQGGKRVECKKCHRLFLSRSGQSTSCADCRKK